MNTFQTFSKLIRLKGLTDFFLHGVTPNDSPLPCRPKGYPLHQLVSVLIILTLSEIFVIISKSHTMLILVLAFVCLCDWHRAEERFRGEEESLRLRVCGDLSHVN